MTPGAALGSAIGSMRPAFVKRRPKKKRKKK